MTTCKRISVAVVAMAAMAAACGGSHSRSSTALSTPAPPPSSTVSTTAPPASTTEPLTGLPAPDGIPDRPVVAVKIDNAPQARPQSGLNAADIVFDALVEGGLSRFLAIYHSHGAPTIGPIRSARPVDADLLPLFGLTIFGYSGAARGEIAPVKDHGGATLVANDDDPRPFHRDKTRPAPSNVYSSLDALLAEGRRLGNRAGPPIGAPFVFGPPGGGTPATTIALTIGAAASTTWHWNASTQHWERDQDGVAHVTLDGGRIVADNVVVLGTHIRGTGIFDAAHEEDPFVSVLGEGEAWVARGGRVTSGHWHRATIRDQFTLADDSGAPMTLNPGRTWVELLPVPHQPVIS